MSVFYTIHTMSSAIFYRTYDYKGKAVTLDRTKTTFTFEADPVWDRKISSFKIGPYTQFCAYTRTQPNGTNGIIFINTTQSLQTITLSNTTVLPTGIYAFFLNKNKVTKDAYNPSLYKYIDRQIIIVSNLDASVTKNQNPLSLLEGKDMTPAKNKKRLGTGLSQIIQDHPHWTVAILLTFVVVSGIMIAYYRSRSASRNNVFFQ